jgi:hypothetical protein
LLLGVSLSWSFGCGARSSTFNDLGLGPASGASANSPPVDGASDPGAGGERVVSQGGSSPIGGGRPELGAGGSASGGRAGAIAAGGEQAEGGAATDFAGAGGAAAGEAATAGGGVNAGGASAGGHGGNAQGGGDADAGTAGAPASNCCTPHATPSCDVAAISECICQGHGHYGGDPFCCTGAWDDQCAGELERFGCGVCPAPP